VFFRIAMSLNGDIAAGAVGGDAVDALIVVAMQPCDAARA
jgi:hypothetical protein